MNPSLRVRSSLDSTGLQSGSKAMNVLSYG
jgi:hypothetical protein